MSATLTTLSAAAPAVGWAVHSWWQHRQLAAARRDPLTSLLTRAAFERRADRLLRKSPCAVLVIDLDDFKLLNDSLGHQAGDAALTGVAQVLDAWTRERGGVAARLGGDEFAATVPLPLAADLPSRLQALEDGLLVGARPLLGVSIGAACSAGLPAPQLPTALGRADAAMYRAKQFGIGWWIADPEDPLPPPVNGRRSGRPGTALAPEGRAA